MKFTWYGKENAIIESMTPSTGTLRPDKESSKNWDDTENLYIEGDNLEVLKLLQKSYFGKVKMIYIDPPYNTGKDFVYKDNFSDSIANYKEITSQTTKANSETNGRYHTDWLNMMYPRLKLARNLLKEDGIIFISINDKEYDNIKKICDEIFSEDNNIANLIWDRNNSAQAGIFKVYHEYILVYCKNKSLISTPRVLETDIFEARAIKKESNRHSPQVFKFPKGTKFIAPENTILEGRIGSLEYIEICKGDRLICKNQKLDEDARVIAPYTQINQMKEFFYGDKNKLVDSRGQKIVEFYLSANGKVQVVKERGVITPSTILKLGPQGPVSKKLADLFELKDSPLDSPKPVKMVETFLEWFIDENDIIVDFFSGSSTTAESVIKFNSNYNKHIKYIMVQIPEQIDSEREVYKAGYKNICEIGKERIRRAGDKIVSENKDKEEIENLDIGFKVFKLEYNCGGENYSTMKEGIKVDIIKRPKDKPICKFKVHGELYYLVKTNEDIIVFPYKSTLKGKAIASIFNIELCKDKDYMQLEYLYNIKLNEFNGEDFIHSQYVTSVILDNVYKNLND